MKISQLISFSPKLPYSVTVISRLARLRSSVKRFSIFKLNILNISNCNAWAVNKNQQITYSYEKVNLLTKSKTLEVLPLKGSGR